MIQNPRQYVEAKRQLGKWTALKERLSKLAAAFSIDELELMQFMDARIELIAKNLNEYHSAKRIDSKDLEILGQIAKFPAILIKARIALGWTQTELARRTGMKVQQINVYEKLAYSSINLSKAIEIALILDAALNERATELEQLKQ